mmetsp:Transcript_116340/g.248849  ORF Transcript_116340/g.248849 Transcript_116340/m.248849 type:complete len:305 (-) Transcript_116340:114-1028(-)
MPAHTTWFIALALAGTKGVVAVSSEEQTPLRYGASVYEEAGMQRPLPSLLRTEEPQVARAAEVETTWSRFGAEPGDLTQRRTPMSAIEVEPSGHMHSAAGGWPMAREGALIGQGIREHVGQIPAATPSAITATPNQAATTATTFCTVPMWRAASFACKEVPPQMQMWVDEGSVNRRKLSHGERCTVQCDSKWQEPDITTMVCKDEKWMVDSGTQVVGIHCQDSGSAWFLIFALAGIFVGICIASYMYWKRRQAKKKRKSMAETVDESEGHGSYGDAAAHDHEGSEEHDELGFQANARQSQTNTL